jgi:isocitrate dehydrogenase
MPRIVYKAKEPAKKELTGIDVFLHWRGGAAEELAAPLRAAETDALKLKLITNRGVKVWPEGFPETFCTDHWRCRFMSDAPATHAQVLALLARVAEAGLDFVKTEHLYDFDGEPQYSLGQGQ